MTPADLDRRLSLRPLRQEDLPLLHRWLNAPHLRRFYQKAPIELDAVRSKYGARLDLLGPTKSHLALFDGVPFGYLQCYRNASYREYAEQIGVWDGASVDLFIGEVARLGRGFGSAMLRAYLDEVFRLFPDLSTVYLLHHRENQAAQACSRRAGLRPLRELLEEGVPSILFRLDRA